MQHFLTTWFSHPRAFWLAPVLVLAFVVALWGWRQRRRALMVLGQNQAVRRLLLLDPRARRLRHICLLLGVLLLFVGSAGPQWGPGFRRETKHGGDILLVLDVSRSMQAEQPSRLERGVRALRDLADHLQKRGGRRIALVVFAAQPQLLFPLTSDYDHLRHVLAQVEAGDLPSGVRPRANDDSGTRIGAALRLAVASRDAEAPLKPVVVLLSDGDDPARDDEWLQGVHEARAADIVIHALGIGDPRQASTIPVGNDVVRHDGRVIKTRLQEAPLKEIARRTGGTYIPGHTHDVPLGSLLDELWRGQNGGAEPSEPASLPVLRQRYTLFLWPALGLLTAYLLLRSRPRVARGLSARLVPVALVLVALVLGAGPLDEDEIRQGNMAFERGDFEAALPHYEKAGLTTQDPGRVAFNQAASLYRLGRHREAELHYRRCLEDEQAPAARRAQAYFGLGISLVRQSGEKDGAPLDQAIDAFAACLALPDLAAEFRTDATYNLELARWLRLNARVTTEKKGTERHPDPEPQKPRKKLEPKPEQKSVNTPGKTQDPEKKGNSKNGAEASQEKKHAGPGPLHMIPDAKALVPIAEEDTLAYLDQLAERILQERRAYVRRSVPVFPQVKDW